MTPRTAPRFLTPTCLALCAAIAMPAMAADLNIRLERVGDTGRLHIYVFTAADGFPKEENAAVHQTYPATSDGRLDLTISVPDAAEYAVMAYQDKDGDGKMNRLLGMIPQEPYALSRNPQVFGKPKFADAAIRPASGEIIVLQLKD